MKKIAITILIFIFLLGSVNLFLHSSYAKQRIEDYLSKAIQDSGFQIRVGKITNLIPSIQLENITIQSSDLSIECDTFSAELSLLYLLKKEITLTKVEANHIRWKLLQDQENKEAAFNESPSFSAFKFNFKNISLKDVEISENIRADLQGNFKFKRNRKGKESIQISGSISSKSFPFETSSFSFNGSKEIQENWIIAPIHIEKDQINATGSAILFPNGRFLSCDLQIQSNPITFSSLFPIKGRFLAQLNMHREKDKIITQANWRIPSLKTEFYEIKNVQGHLNAFIQSQKLEGTLQGSADFPFGPMTASSSIQWFANGSFSLPDLDIKSAPLILNANLGISSDRIITGKTSLALPQIHELTPQLYAALAGEIVWENQNNTQVIHSEFTANNIYYKEFKAEKAHIFFDGSNPFQEINGFVSLNIEDGAWKTLTIHTAYLESTKNKDFWPFQFSLNGDWKHPLELTLSGDLIPKETTTLILKQTSGSFFEHPFTSTDSIHIAWSSKHISIPQMTLQVGEGLVQASINSDIEKTNATLSMKTMPLDILSLNPLDLPINGTFDLNASLEGPNDKLSGRFTSSIQDLNIHRLGEVMPVNADGAFNGILEKNSLSLKGDLTFQSSPFLSFNVKLPVHLQMWPFQMEPILEETIKGNLSLSGHIENWLDFFDVGTHRLEGACELQMTVGNTLGHPLMQGYCHLDNGYYQNYFTGTELKNIKAAFSAHQNLITLDSLTATDAQDKGQFFAKGILHLSLQENFPFEYDVTFDRFTFASQDLVTSEAEGSLKITGNLQEALAFGHLNVIETDISIPARLARALPELQVVYKNAIAPQILPTQKQNHYPLNLDIQVDAPDGIFISGRGLESEWKGNFHVKGTQTAIATQGKIELIKGSFVFSGREFKLTEGSLLFTGQENKEPFLNLAATITIKDVAITAYLRGSISDPQITLQSSPPLPMGTIMSYLLFGQDLAEINSFQALQLANSLASLAGEGPNLLESTRKSLGIDQIQILTIPSRTQEGEDTIALQVGKYVVEGVLVSYSQGAEDSSQNIKIEIEGTGGFSFLLESDQSQEQGKFTIRWGHTY